MVSLFHVNSQGIYTSFSVPCLNHFSGSQMIPSVHVNVMKLYRIYFFGLGQVAGGSFKRKYFLEMETVFTVIV